MWCMYRVLQEKKSGPSGAYIDSVEELVRYCKKDSVSKAVLMMQHALSSGTGGQPTHSQKQDLEVQTLE